MCRPATCKHCGQATYRGCGMHIEQVLAGVPRSQRCTCGGKPPKAESAKASGVNTHVGFLRRLMRRG